MWVGLQKDAVSSSEMLLQVSHCREGFPALVAGCVAGMLFHVGQEVALHGKGLPADVALPLLGAPTPAVFPVPSRQRVSTIFVFVKGLGDDCDCKTTTPTVIPKSFT